jgi:protein BUR2
MGKMWEFSRGGKVSGMSSNDVSSYVHFPGAPSPPSLSSRRSPPRPQISVASHPPTIMTTKGIESQSQWLFTEEEVRNSPSVHDGLSVADEISRRTKGVNFIT